MKKLDHDLIHLFDHRQKIDREYFEKFATYEYALKNLILGYYRAVQKWEKKRDDFFRDNKIGEDLR